MLDVHPDVETLAFLIGTWRGEGTGAYPTIITFGYGEEVRFAEMAGKPFLAYSQRTWALDDGRGLHAEAGYWRPQPGGRLEVVLAHPTGLAEIQQGSVAGGCIELEATSIGHTDSAKRVAALTRRFELVEPGVLRYTVGMEAAGQPLQTHLRAELRRVEGE